MNRSRGDSRTPHRETARRLRTAVVRVTCGRQRGRACPLEPDVDACHRRYNWNNGATPMLPGLGVGDVVYDIRTGEQNWPGVGDTVIGKEWLSVILHVTSQNPADIPTRGLSLYLG